MCVRLTRVFSTAPQNCHSGESRKPVFSTMKSYYVYIMASKRNGTLYVGVTGNLVKRVTQHRLGHVPGFTKRYGVKMLVWFERHADVREAIMREKRIKEWKRRWKLELIERTNPNWRDLYDDLE